MIQFVWVLICYLGKYMLLSKLVHLVKGNKFTYTNISFFGKYWQTLVFSSPKLSSSNLMENTFVIIFGNWFSFALSMHIFKVCCRHFKNSILAKLGLISHEVNKVWYYFFETTSTINIKKASTSSYIRSFYLTGKVMKKCQ